MTSNLPDTPTAGYASEIRIQDVCLPGFYQGTPHYCLHASVTAESQPQEVLDELRTDYLSIDPDFVPTIRENVWQDFYAQLRVYLPDAIRHIEPVPEDAEPDELVYLYVEVVPEQEE